MALICEETCEQVPSSRATFILCWCKSTYDEPDDDIITFGVIVHILLHPDLHGMTVEDKRFTSTPKDACKHVKIAWRATLIAKEYWKNYKLAQYQGWGTRFALPDQLRGKMRGAVVMDEKLNDLGKGGIGKITFIPTQGEIEKYNINTHYAVKSYGNDVSCSCKGYIYHNKCKHVNWVIKREKRVQNRRDLGISLAVLYIGQNK